MGMALVGALSSNSILHPVIFWASRVNTSLSLNQSGSYTNNISNYHGYFAVFLKMGTENKPPKSGLALVMQLETTSSEWMPSRGLRPMPCGALLETTRSLKWSLRLPKFANGMCKTTFFSEEVVPIIKYSRVLYMLICHKQI